MVEGNNHDKAGARDGGVTDQLRRGDQSGLSADILKVDGVSLSFGGLAALADVSFVVRRGEFFSIIGPNGAGKTSMLNCLSGRYKPQSGSLRYYPGGNNGDASARAIGSQATDKLRRGVLAADGGRGDQSGLSAGGGGEINLLKLPINAHAREGIARTFQNLALFEHISVLDNILVGAHHTLRCGFLRGALHWVGGARREELAARGRMEDIIDFLELQSFRHTPTGALAYGIRKRVELARAIACAPKLLLLDEPMAGMNLDEKEDMARFIVDLNEEWGITIIMIEHDMGVVADISERVLVLDFGRVIACGEAAEIMRHPEVKRAYLGDAAAAN